ncbi:MAG: DUF541 domain-containing protein [Planctomycetes bacterium]|nr:DUF541 domain-containing protein [Planctomycetota bacterium]
MSTARINLFWLIIFTLTLPMAVVASTWLARSSFEKVRLRDQTIRVKGYAERPITSDRAEWSSTIIERNADRTAAYRQLAEHRDALMGYLQSQSFKGDEVEPGPVNISPQYTRDAKGNQTNTIELYVVTQSFTVASPRVDKVAEAARDAGQLIAEGVELDSNSPSYLYTKLDDLKLDLLKDATQNAYQRAQLLVSNSTSRLGPLRSASQGVFQITPAFSTEVSGSGENDTTSLSKIIRAVVTVEYGIVE